MMTTVYLLRHVTSLPQEGVANAAWPLTGMGMQQAQALVPHLEQLGVTAVVSSPTLRAHQTVQPFATAAQLHVEEHAGLGDQYLTEGTLAPADFQALTRAMWADFNHSDAGVESNAACQARMSAALAEIAGEHAGQTVLVCSHAAPIALFLNTLDPSFGYDDWANMHMPHLYKFYFNGENFQWETGFATPAV